MQILCPKCGHVLAGSDMNVVTDIARCPRCEDVFALSPFVHANVSGLVDPNNPPQGAWYQAESNGFDVGATTWHRIGGSIMLAIFVPLSVLMWIWFGGVIWNCYGLQIVQGRFDLDYALLGLLLGTISILLALLFSSIALQSVFGKVVVRVRDSEGVVFIGFGSYGWRRRFDPRRITTVRIELPFADGNNLVCIVLEGPQKLRFGSMLSEPRRDFIANVLRHELIKRN